MASRLENFEPRELHLSQIPTPTKSPVVARSIIAGAWIGVSVMLCLGCGSKEVARGDHATAHLKVLGILYGQCMADNGGKAPANADQLAAHLQREPANWDKLAASPQEFLSLGSDGSRLVVLYGNDVKAIGDGVPWVAYESTEVDGARLVVNAQGGVQLMDKAEFGQHFPNP
jgi:hypothetical protein